MRVQACRDKKKIAFLKKKLRTERHRNRELEPGVGEPLKELERKYEVEKTLMKNQAYQAQLDAANVSYEKGQEVTMDLMA